jgi:hypothetical protein
MSEIPSDYSEAAYDTEHSELRIEAIELLKSFISDSNNLCNSEAKDNFLVRKNVDGQNYTGIIILNDVTDELISYMDSTEEDCTSIIIEAEYTEYPIVDPYSDEITEDMGYILRTFRLKIPHNSIGEIYGTKVDELRTSFQDDGVEVISANHDDMPNGAFMLEPGRKKLLADTQENLQQITIEDLIDLQDVLVVAHEQVKKELESVQGFSG